MLRTRNILFIVGIILAVIPGLSLTISNVATDIQGISPFSMLALVIMIGPGIVFSGLAIAVISGIKSPKKLLISAIVFVLHFAFIPLNNAISTYKLHSFFETHKSFLEKISTGLFVSEFTTEEANELLIDEELPIVSIHFDATQQIVFFIIDGVLDNCQGFAFRFSGLQPVATPCGGKIVDWDKLNSGWYIWSTI